MTAAPSPQDLPDSPVHHDESLDLLIRSDQNIQLNNQKSKRHSAIVRSMRLILPIAALAVVVMIMSWKSDINPVTPVPREEVSPETVSQNELINPKFGSEDSRGQQYSITADKATQNADDMNTLMLEKPVADMTLTSGGTVSLKASNGEYKQQEKGLILNGNVEVQHDSGYKIQTERMSIDVAGQIINSNSPVTGHGPEADISASGLNVNGQSKVLIFNGPAKLTLHPASLKPDSLPKDE